MLVLARKTHETIHIGEDIAVSIVSIRGRVVRLGIKAPGGLRVVRGEIAGSPPANPVARQIARTQPDAPGPIAEMPPLPADSYAPSQRPTTQQVNRMMVLRRRLSRAEAASPAY